MPYNPTTWQDGVTPASQTHMNNLELQYGEATNSFNQDELLPFVLNGLSASKDVTTASKLDVTAGVAYLVQPDGTLRRRAYAATSFTVLVASMTYYLDAQPDGTWSWATSHSGMSGYLAIMQVTTDASANILTVIDARATTNFQFNTQTGGFVTPAPLYTAVTQRASLAASVVGGVTFGQQSLLSSSMNGAALCNGSTGYLSLPTSGLPTGNNPWTIEAWFKTSSSGGSQVIAFAGAPATKQAMWLYLDSAGHLSLDLFNSALVTSTAGYNNGARHHVMATWDGTNATLYADGAQVATSATLGPDNISYSYGLIGAYYTGSAYAAFFNGVLDEVAIYGAALTSTRVTAHYNAGVSITSDAYAATVEADSPLRYYRLGDASGATTAACSQAAQYFALVDSAQNLSAQGSISAAQGISAGGAVSATGNVSAGGTLSATGSASVGGALASLGGQASAGSLGAPVIVAQAIAVHVTSTAALQMCAFTPPSNGIYRVSMHIYNGNTSAQNITASVSYSDPNAGTPTSYFSFQANPANTTVIPLDGSNSIQIGISIATYPLVVYAKGGVAVQALYHNPGGSPNDYISVVIERLS